MKKRFIFLALLLTVGFLQAQVTSNLFATGFTGANGLTFDGSGYLYVANINGNTVSKVDQGGNIVSAIVGFNHPTGIDFDPSGNLYVANDWSGTVSIVDKGGLIANTYTGFPTPTALTLDAAGNLYVVNGFGSVSRVDGSGNIVPVYSGSAFTTSIDIDAAGDIYLPSTFNNQVIKLDASGHITATFVGFTFPSALVLDPAGNLFVASIDGSIGIIPAGSADGASPTPFIAGLPYQPYGITYHDNALYVSDGGSNVYKITGGALALPLTLVNFTGREQGSSVLLSWQTGDELHTSTFDVEKSLDGVNFKTVGKLNTGGDGSHSYGFTDDNSSVHSTSVYYRLKMTDVGGHFEYSKIIKIQLVNGTTQFTLYPNPAKDYISVNVPQAGQAKIYNAAGILVSTVQLGAGNNSIDIGYFSAGVYFVVSGNHKVKFIKL